MGEISESKKQPITGEDYSLALTNVVQLGRYSFEMEQRRGESIIKQAGEMLTAFSVFSAALLMAIPLLINYTPVNPTKLLTWIGAATVPLIISLCTAIIAQWRFKYQGMINAEEFQKTIFNSIKQYRSQDQYDMQWVYQLSSMHRSIEKINNLRVVFVKISMACFSLSIAIITISICVFLLK